MDRRYDAGDWFRDCVVVGGGHAVLSTEMVEIEGDVKRDVAGVIGPSSLSLPEEEEHEEEEIDRALIMGERSTQSTPETRRRASISILTASNSVAFFPSSLCIDQARKAEGRWCLSAGRTN